MTSQAHLTDPELLASLREALGLFAVSGQSALLEAEAAIGATEEWLQDRHRYWQGEVKRRIAALNVCIALVVAAGGGSCAGEEAAVVAAKKEVETAEHWIGEVNQAAATYRANESRFRSVVEGKVYEAQSFLAGKEQTVSGHYHGGAGTGGSSGAVASGGSASGGGSSGGSGGSPSLARYQANGESFADAPLSLVEDPQFAPSEWDNTDVPDMQHSFARLPEVQQAIRNGTIDQLRAGDADLNRVFTWFYGGEAVRLEWYKGQYTITGGKHRVYMARMLGLSNLPATVLP